MSTPSLAIFEVLQRRVNLFPKEAGPIMGMSIRLAWISPEKPVEHIQACWSKVTEEPIALPKESVVSSPQQIVNFATLRPSAIACEKIARESSKTMGITWATKSHRATV